jgi:PAS domain S-box-containing protein
LREIVTKALRPLYMDIPALQPGTVGAYALAIVSVGFATALRVALDPFLLGAQFVTFFPAIAITTLMSGFGAGFLCAVLSTAAADFFVLSPRFSFYIDDPAVAADLLLFGPLATYCAFLIGRMRIAVERAKEKASKDRLQLALDAAQLGWWHYDPSGDVILADARLKEIFDFAADKTPVEEFMERVHPDDAARVWADREAALDLADPKPYAHEYRVQRRDGEFRWVEAHGLADFDGSGRERRLVSFVGTAQDITERKQHEERERLLMREINHRAKNMLSVVAAIAHQTVGNSPEDYVEHVSERIRALAAHQDLLVRSEWHGVEIGDLVRAQLSHFADLIGIRIAMQGAKLRLNPASAQAIGLAFHELATNAAKYGALSTDTGRIDVGWGIDGDTLTVTWTERDGPPVSPPKRRGFGTMVMKEMAERSLGGKVDLDYAPSGATWRLTCPAANALEPLE